MMVPYKTEVWATRRLGANCSWRGLTPTNVHTTPHIHYSEIPGCSLRCWWRRPFMAADKLLLKHETKETPHLCVSVSISLHYGLCETVWEKNHTGDRSNERSFMLCCSEQQHRPGLSPKNARLFLLTWKLKFLWKQFLLDLSKMLWQLEKQKETEETWNFTELVFISNRATSNRNSNLGAERPKLWS